MKITLWGTRGSLPAPGIETARYGGNTSCVQVQGDEGTLLVLDAGTGIRRLGGALARSVRRIDILLTHLHLDHIQGLGFFGPIDNPDYEVHIWGPASTTQSLRARLTRYLSPPLFPIRLRDLPSKLFLHETPCDDCEIGEFRVCTALVCHPGPTVGYRIEHSAGVLAYMSDHEPALGVEKFPGTWDWTSGYSIAKGADVLIHDAQYSRDEYVNRIGWGHSSIQHAVEFAKLAGVKDLLPFHHDPGHTDTQLDQLMAEAGELANGDLNVTPGIEGASFEI